jgi:hypothetical protein
MRGPDPSIAGQHLLQDRRHQVDLDASGTCSVTTPSLMIADIDYAQLGQPSI